AEMVGAERAAVGLADVALHAVDGLPLRAVLVLAGEDQDRTLRRLAEGGVLVELGDRPGGVVARPGIEVDDEDGYVPQRRLRERLGVVVDEGQGDGGFGRCRRGGTAVAGVEGEERFEQHAKRPPRIGDASPGNLPRRVRRRRAARLQWRRALTLLDPPRRVGRPAPPPPSRRGAAPRPRPPPARGRPPPRPRAR